ncbi:VOC family protein [Anaerovibrio lipolyticus]|jgi:predicted enzyme related to lactoylglutathione lyase|uniref:VOC family protein n=1 Tax=Anaerovibrio lipolyticus TaxID=82374 RepID=UPI0026F1B646|nr:VOC family protein [Anaerovibrio lipolyticus]MBE6105117.1 VOC family protein [Anaerovibrio lipolyticus]
MIQLRHIGLYVQDMKKEAEFYRQAFSMYEICNELEQSDALIDELLSVHEPVKITKLITEQGRQSGVGDMLELVEYPNSPEKELTRNSLYKTGVMHLGFGIDNMDETLMRIKVLGGSQVTLVHTMANGNKCCFCKDPEGNWLELIERSSG